MTFQNYLRADEMTKEVKLQKTMKSTFGICLVKGEVLDSPGGKISGLFIKDIHPQSIAYNCGKLKIGDRISLINENDLRDTAEEKMIELIRAADQTITLQLHAYDSGKKTMKETSNSNNDNSMMSSNKNDTTTNDRNQNGYNTSSTTNQNNNNSQPKSSSSNAAVESDDDDDEDTRDMTGRMYTEGGVEIDRASAGNVKRSKAEMEADKETEDEFGYTQGKIKKRYGNLGAVHKTEVIRQLNTPLGLALAGHKDKTKMCCIVAGVNPAGVAATANLKAGDEILEINGNVLQNRCHLNSSVIFKSLPGEKMVFVVLRTNNLKALSVKPVDKFAAVVDPTEYLFTSYKNVRGVQIQKTGVSLGIMVIAGKHSEVGNGIFISDLQDGSNAELAGLQIGEMILAINKDILVEADYDSAVGLLRRAEGVVNLVVANLQSEEQLAEKEKAEKAKEEKKAAPPPEPEKPQDPATADIKTNKKTLIEIKAEKKPLGCLVVGGKDTLVTTGVVITHIVPDGVFGTDKRLQIYDQILEFNGTPLNAAEMSGLKCSQWFFLPYEKVTLMVWRNDPPEVETHNIEVTKKPGKDFGLSLQGNCRGVVVREITPAGYADIENKMQKGDIIRKLNEEVLEGVSFEGCMALFRALTGKIVFEVVRPKPTCRTK